jgi:hypothetical protein
MSLDSFHCPKHESHPDTFPVHSVSHVPPNQKLRLPEQVWLGSSVAHSGHNIMIDNAPVVIQAIHMVVDAVRAGQTSLKG